MILKHSNLNLINKYFMANIIFIDFMNFYLIIYNNLIYIVNNVTYLYKNNFRFKI